MTVPTSASAAVPVSTDGNVGPPIQFQLPRSSAVEFIEGFGEGLLAAGTDFVDGLEALWSGVERASDWAYAVFFELRRGDTTAVSQDIAKIGVAIKKGVATLGPVAEVVWQLVLDTDLFYEALVLREEAAIEQLGEEYGLYLEMMAELIDATRELLASIEITSHQKGWIAGRLTGEIVVEVGLSLATGGAGTAIRAVQKSKKIVGLPLSDSLRIWPITQDRRLRRRSV
jgi:hypothetical protein